MAVLLPPQQVRGLFLVAGVLSFVLMMRLWRGTSARIATGGFMSEADTAARAGALCGVAG